GSRFAPGKGTRKNGPDAIQAPLTGGAGSPRVRGVVHELPDRAPRRVMTERVQIRPAKPAPRRMQNAEPRDAVGRMQQRARQAREVMSDLQVAQAVDFDGMHG